MIIKNKTVEFQTKDSLEFIDITEKIEEFIAQSKAKDGIVNVQILHTSAALIVNENEPLLIEDFKKNIENIALSAEKYKHDNLNERTVNVCDRECINGHSHCKAIHLLASATLNIIGEKLQLGQWQRVFLVELDRPRNRRIQIQIIAN